MYEENRNIKFYLPIILVIGGFILFGSCNKNNNYYISYHRGIETSKQYTEVQQMMTQVMGTYFKSITDSLLLNDGNTYIDGANIRLVEDSVSRLIIEYPVWGNDDGYGHYRQGIYEATTATGFLHNDAEIQFQFNDFIYDLNPIIVDSMFLVNEGKLDGKNESYHLAAKMIDMEYADTTGSITFNMDETITVYKQAGTFYTSHRDSIGIYGSLNGNSKYELDFEAVNEESSSLLFSYSCNWLKKGIVRLDVEDFKYTSNIYFSNPDTCANLFLIEIENNPFPFPIEE